ncbi:hypothetical protein BJ508DRAFT_411589 [Ascobolus immersus RN42]|uniref:Uncharacterized protein n=1 Tax=Ascobolus immersus RN42 TaxID=1160509 RepID=A0A3N4IKN0_ASCIM|nr:hypothetical protein BJ508DRAFT_411589 [Ascobolus immersus RN42]
MTIPALILTTPLGLSFRLSDSPLHTPLDHTIDGSADNSLEIDKSLLWTPKSWYSNLAYSHPKFAPPKLFCTCIREPEPDHIRRRRKGDAVPCDERIWRNINWDWSKVYSTGELSLEGLWSAFLHHMETRGTEPVVDVNGLVNRSSCMGPVEDYRGLWESMMSMGIVQRA